MTDGRAEVARSCETVGCRARQITARSATQPQPPNPGEAVRGLGVPVRHGMRSRASLPPLRLSRQRRDPQRNDLSQFFGVRQKECHRRRPKIPAESGPAKSPLFMQVGRPENSAAHSEEQKWAHGRASPPRVVISTVGRHGHDGLKEGAPWQRRKRPTSERAGSVRVRTAGRAERGRGAPLGLRRYSKGSRRRPGLCR